jgi:hypothetical protein
VVRAAGGARAEKVDVEVGEAAASLGVGEVV